MVVVVGDAPLVAGGVPGRLDPPEQADVGERAEHVVHGLDGDPGEGRAHGLQQGVGIGVRVVPDGVQHGEPRLRHAQPELAQRLGVGHGPTQPRYLESFKYLR